MASRDDLQAKEADCTSAAQFADLVSQALQDPADREYAEELVQKIEGLCVEVEETVAYATALHQLGRGEDQLRPLLDAAEVDCQFTKQFVALAGGYQRLLGDTAKMTELMEQAEEFCMTDEEQIDLGDGFQMLLGDAERASACYEKGLAGVQDKEALLALAEKFAGPLNNPELARTVYTRTEEKMSSGNELRRLVQSIMEHLDDRELAGGVLNHAADRITGAADLINLAGDCRTLGLNDLAAQMYRKVLDATDDTHQLMKLIAPLKEMDGGAALIREVLNRACEGAEDSQSLLEIAQQAHEATQDAELVRSVLEQAEEQTTSLGGLKAVVEAVSRFAEGDAAWQERLAEKVEKRQANQARYIEFQDLEQTATTPLALIQLAARVAQELDDRFYARKLLASAQSMLAEASPDINISCLLARSVDQYLEDGDWVRQILDQIGQHATDFSAFRAIAHTAAYELNDRETGRAWARAGYEQWQEKLSADVYDCLRLARAVLEDLGDTAYVGKLLEQAARNGGDALATAQIGLLARESGNEAGAEQWFKQSLEACATPEASISVMHLLRRGAVAEPQLRDLYQSATPQPTAERLQWVEGIMEVFQDPEWCQQAYEELAPNVTDPLWAKRLTASRESRLGRFLIR